MAPAPGVFGLLMSRAPKILRLAVKSASKYAKTKIPAAAIAAQPAPVYAYASPRQPIHPFAFLRQSKRWLSTSRRISEAIHRVGTPFLRASGPTSSASRANYSSSRVAFKVSQSTGRAPFASTLRPNLTGGVLPRTAGGYSLGYGGINGARYFSHTPQAPVQVIQNVSQGVRAFIMAGKKVHYDGVDRRTGEKRYKAVSALQDKATRTMNAVPKATPGSFIDFSVNPTITALTPLGGIMGYDSAPATTAMDTLHSEGLMDVLSVDFTRALKELQLVMADIQNLARLGDLPISYQDSKLRVHFPGCDPETVERLAEELNVQRGVIGQDPDFDDYVGTEIALLFPFAPSADGSIEASMHTQPSPPQNNQIRTSIPSSQAMSSFDEHMTISDTGLAYDDLEVVSSPWLDSEAESVPLRELYEARRREEQGPLEYRDFEGLYRFIEYCDARRR